MALYWTLGTLSNTVNRMGSSSLVAVLQVATFARDKWEHIGWHLGFEVAELKEYKEKSDSLYLRLLYLLEDWKKKQGRPIVGAIISACEKAGIGGEARRKLNIME